VRRFPSTRGNGGGGGGANLGFLHIFLVRKMKPSDGRLRRTISQRKIRMGGNPFDQSDRPPDRPTPRWLPRDGYPGLEKEGRVGAVAREMNYRYEHGSPRSQGYHNVQHQALLASNGVNAATLHREGLHVGPPSHQEVMHANVALRDWQRRHHARQSNQAATRGQRANPVAKNYDLHGYLKPGGSGRRHVAEPGAPRHPAEGPSVTRLRQLQFENNTDVATFEPSLRACASSAAWMMSHGRPSADWQQRSLSSHHSSPRPSSPRSSSSRSAHTRPSPRGARPSSPRLLDGSRRGAANWQSETGWLRSHHAAGSKQPRPESSRRDRLRAHSASAVSL
jgi:hypothetical protein